MSILVILKSLKFYKKFYSSLTSKKNSDEEYEHVLKVWKTFQMKSMEDYHDLCIKCDVLLVADVFETFKS